jgi:hypothetical protein
MPPKGPSKKTEQKAKQKIVEDKTFGLKNKNKSTKVGKYVQQVEKTVFHGNQKASVPFAKFVEGRGATESLKGKKEG